MRDYHDEAGPYPGGGGYYFLDSGQNPACWKPHPDLYDAAGNEIEGARATWYEMNDWFTPGHLESMFRESQSQTPVTKEILSDPTKVVVASADECKKALEENLLFWGIRTKKDGIFTAAIERSQRRSGGESSQQSTPERSNICEDNNEVNE